MRSLVLGSRSLRRVMIAALLLGAVICCASCGSSPGGRVLTDSLSEPLNGARAAKIDIDAGDGNLTIDALTGGEHLLAGGTLQYLEEQGPPSRTMTALMDQATLTLRRSGVGRRGFRFPWAACNGATEWQIHLNPTVLSEITAHSDGGNVRLNLAGLAIAHVAADTGGGNMDVVLPDNAADLNVLAKTGAGNVSVLVPRGLGARIHATSGLGQVIVDPQFSQIDDNTYESPDYAGAANRIEIAAHSGAGNVSVNTK
ncbi:MAG: hypothetical protein JXA74_16950 [Anaerolineae bacterium]|nr:hypothetical protein [Anaerolineae bacterium]